jgi:phosphoglycolate phosphatase-like HAD superfamily hydrolase
VVGDSPADVMMGRAAGARTGAALWSSSNRERLLAQEPDFLFESPSQLLDCLSSETT